MALIYNIQGLKEVRDILNSDILVQKFINHNAVLHKIYCIGDKVYMFLRPSLPNESELNSQDKDYIFYGRISKYEDPSCSCDVYPSQNFVEGLCNYIRQIYQLGLFGIDLITELDQKDGIIRHFIIDINYFPSYSGISEIPIAFTDLITKRLLSIQ